MVFSLFKKSPEGPAKKTTGPTTFGNVMRYTHTPQIGIRLKRLGEKLGYFSFLLALVYRSARLLPAGHPMLNPANIGRFGVRDVIATAANRLVMKRENMDQIMIFGAVMVAVVMIVIQAIMLCLYAFIDSAKAAGPADSMFTTPSPNQDIVFQFLRNVFGVNSMFGGSGSDTAVQAGLHALLGFYSTAMMIIAVIIVVYYTITVVGESAQSGTPFGRRFNGLWAPIRLVMALGLLVPLGGGLNTAQYLVLNVAKLGSGLASQGWKTFVNTFESAGSTGAGVGAPSMQQIGGSVLSAEVCRAAFNQVYSGSKSVKIYLRYQPASGRLVIQEAAFTAAEVSSAVSAGANSIMYSWIGRPIGASASAFSPTSKATCGSISMSLKKSKGTSEIDTAINTINTQMQGAYIAALNTLVSGLGGISSQASGSPAVKVAQKSIAFGNTDWVTNSTADMDSVATAAAGVIDSAQTQINSAVRSVSFGDLRGNLISKMKTEAGTRGWGTAGAYYASVSKINSMTAGAVNASYPKGFETGSGLSSGMKDSQTWWGWLGETTGLWTDSDKQVKQVLMALNDLNTATMSKVSVGTINPAGNFRSASEKFGVEADASSIFSNPIYTFAVWQFGDAFIQLFDEPTLNPMPVLVGAGGKLLDHAGVMAWWYIVSQLGSVAAAVIGTGWGAAVGGPGGAAIGAVGFTMLSQLLAAASGFLWLTVTIGATVGIVLFFLLPLMPFMYFTFSTINWVIEVAEAFVSMPLFALAHLRIDGEGMPGQTAYAGYLTLFGVMMRPLLIIVGLIVSSLIFGAGVYFINSVYLEAVFAYRPSGTTKIDLSQLGGFELVTYLVLYVYMIYTLANSTFKLIDTIPDKMMRWIGGSTPFTGDKPADIGHFQGMAVAGYVAMTQGKGAFEGATGTARNMASSKDPNKEAQLRGFAGSHMKDKLWGKRSTEGDKTPPPTEGA